MSSDWNPDKLLLGIARDLRAIEDMFDDLKQEAINRAGDPDIPGGAAMYMLGPSADIEAFSYMQMSAAMGRIDEAAVETNVAGDIEPPLSFLASWVDDVRKCRDQLTDLRATIKREADYIRGALPWMVGTDEDGEPNYVQVDDFANGLKKVRRAMENVLRDGYRAERIAAECKNCEPSPQLCLRRGDAKDGSQDHWYCPHCRHAYDADGVALCWRQMFVKRPAAPEWMPLRKAAMAVNRPVTSLRRWTIAPVDGMGNPLLDRKGEPKKAKVESEVRPDGNRWVRWSDVRAADDTIARRNRKRQEHANVL